MIAHTHTYASARVAGDFHPINSHDRKFKNIPIHRGLHAGIRAYSRWRLEIVSGRLIRITAVAKWLERIAVALCVPPSESVTGRSELKPTNAIETKLMMPKCYLITRIEACVCVRPMPDSYMPKRFGLLSGHSPCGENGPISLTKRKQIEQRRKQKICLRN